MLDDDGDRFPPRQFVLFRATFDLINGCFADTTLRTIDYTLQRDRVVRIQRELQIRDDVAYFHELIERKAANDVVLQTGTSHRFFKNTRLRVGAIEHRRAYVKLIAPMLEDLARHPTRFGFGIE